MRSFAIVASSPAPALTGLTLLVLTWCRTRMRSLVRSPGLWDVAICVRGCRLWLFLALFADSRSCLLCFSLSVPCPLRTVLLVFGLCLVVLASLLLFVDLNRVSELFAHFLLFSSTDLHATNSIMRSFVCFAIVMTLLLMVSIVVVRSLVIIIDYRLLLVIYDNVSH